MTGPRSTEAIARETVIPELIFEAQALLRLAHDGDSEAWLQLESKFRQLATVPAEVASAIQARGLRPLSPRRQTV